MVEFPLQLPHLVEFTCQIISVWKNPSLLQMVSTEIYINVQMYVYIRETFTILLKPLEKNLN